MSYASRWALTQGASAGAIAGVIAGSLVNAAIAISSETSATTNHANRVALAKQVVINPLAWGFTFMLGVLDNLAVDTAAQLSVVTDAQVDTAVSALWNTYAGVV